MSLKSFVISRWSFVVGRLSLVIFSVNNKLSNLLKFAFADVGRCVGLIQPLGKAFDGHYAMRVG